MNRKPTVFIISGKSPLGDSGGYPAYAYNLARILTSLGHEVSIFAVGDTVMSKKTRYCTIYFSNTRLIRLFPVLRHIALAGLPYYSIILYKTMRKVLRSSGSRKCIVWGMGPWGFAGILLKLFHPQSTSITLFTSYFTSTRHEMHGAYKAIRVNDYGTGVKLKYFFVYHLVARMFHIFEQLTLWWCDRIIVHYRSSEKIVKKYFSVSQTKIIRFPWYVDIFSRKDSQSRPLQPLQHPLIVSICRQDPRKGLNFLIRAMQQVVSVMPNAHLLIVGSGEFLELNKNLVKKLHLEKNVSVVGFVSDIRPILREADIAVVVPLAQGSSALTVLEAMSYSKAVIGSRCDGIPEDIRHNVSGLLVPPGNIHSLAHAILKLCQDTSLRKRLGESAYITYKKQFGFDKLQENIEHVLAQSYISSAST